MAKRPETAVPALDDLCDAAYSLGHAFNKLYQPLLKRLDLTYPDAAVETTGGGQPGHQGAGQGR